jgi:uncharacterized protein (TIGR03067 family)
MRFPKAFLLVCVAGLIAANEPRQDESASLMGDWSVVSLRLGAKTAPPDVISKGLGSHFDDKTYNRTIARKITEFGEYNIDDTKMPKTIDLVIKMGEDKGKRQLGIYKIEGKKLTMILTQPGSMRRPKSFEPESGLETLEVVLERTK